MTVTIQKTIDLNLLSLEELRAIPQENLADILFECIHNTLDPKEKKLRKNKHKVFGHKKKNTSSQFHYVSWNKQYKAWQVQIVNELIGYFDDEITAAIAADKHLDLAEDTDRPRNRVLLEKVV